MPERASKRTDAKRGDGKPKTRRPKEAPEKKAPETLADRTTQQSGFSVVQPLKEKRALILKSQAASEKADKARAAVAKIPVSSPRVRQRARL